MPKPVRFESPAPVTPFALLLLGEGLEVEVDDRVCVPLDVNDDKTEVEKPEVEGVGVVVDRVTKEIDGDVGVETGNVDEVERVPTVTVDNTSLGLLPFTTDEGTGMEDVATGLGSANDPVILSSRKKGEKAA